MCVYIYIYICVCVSMWAYRDICKRIFFCFLGGGCQDYEYKRVGLACVCVCENDVFITVHFVKINELLNLPLNPSRAKGRQREIIYCTKKKHTNLAHGLKMEGRLINTILIFNFTRLIHWPMFYNCGRIFFLYYHFSLVISYHSVWLGWELFGLVHVQVHTLSAVHARARRL